jgi:hypothetical protein
MSIEVKALHQWISGGTSINVIGSAGYCCFDEFLLEGMARSDVGKRYRVAFVDEAKCW